MNTWVEAPPRKGLGCVGRGCLILSVFAIVLAIACFAGMYWGLYRHSALFYGSYWLAKTRSLAEAQAPVTEFSGSEQQLQRVRERWQEFQQKTRASQPAEIELSADDINALIASSEEARGKLFTAIEGNQLQLQTSLPIGQFLGRDGYYFNGQVIIELDGPQPLDSRGSPALRSTASKCRRISWIGSIVPEDCANM